MYEVLPRCKICNPPDTLRNYAPKSKDSAAWPADCLRETVEPFLYNAGVDIVLHGALPRAALNCPSYPRSPQTRCSLLIPWFMGECLGMCS